jgi:hypothetical protein
VTGSEETLDTLFDKLCASADPATAGYVIGRMHAIASRDCLNLNEFGLDNTSLQQLRLDACVRRATVVRTLLATGDGLPHLLERELRQLLQLGVQLDDIDLTDETHAHLVRNAWKRALPGIIKRLQSDCDSHEHPSLVAEDLYWVKLALRKANLVMDHLSADDRALMVKAKEMSQAEYA